MKAYYTSERNAQIVLALLKAHGIKKIIASPGATNVCLIASMQQDPYFEMYSAADERSAAYIACGLAAESGEPVVLSCTGATASRNYAPGLTEAFYRKLPVLAITSSQPIGRIGHHMPQVTDRRNPPADEVKLSVHLPVVHDAEEEWECVTKVNQAILELTRNGGGPVHVNLTTMYSMDFSVRELPSVRVIRRIEYGDPLPSLSAKQVAIYVGAHLRWSDRLTKAVDAFCEHYNGVVLCDQTSNYRGKYGVDACLVANQTKYSAPCCTPELMIHMGEITGAYMLLNPKQVWRVSPDGEMRDTFKKLQYVFAMSETTFFEGYQKSSASHKQIKMPYYEEWNYEREAIEGKIPELPFSNAWATKTLLPMIPPNSVLHMGILNSLRSCNYWKSRKDILGYCNTGGFGIDGCVSSLIGASLSDKNRLYYGVVGDLAFFYDMNSLGNRNIGNNIRLMIVNNGKGFEFKYYCNFATKLGLGEAIEPYIAAAGHYGNQSRLLLKHYAADLGLIYLSAATKDEFKEAMKVFTQSEKKQSMILEVFTNSDDENRANEMIETAEVSASRAAKQLAKNMLGDKGVQKVKKILGR